METQVLEAPASWPNRESAKLELRALHSQAELVNELSDMHRLSLNLNDELWGELQSLPKGERSRFVEQSLVHSLELRRRQQAAARLTELRERITPVSVDLTEELRRLRHAE